MVKMADKIFVLEAGKIASSGSRENIIEEFQEEGRYANILDAQTEVASDFQDDEEDEDQKEEPAPPKEEEEEPDGLAERAGAFAELPEVQLLLCVAILADVAGAAVTAARDDGAPAFLVRAAAAFPGFVNFLYAFELLALATAFKLRMLTHPGLLLDVGIVSARRRRPLFFSARRWRLWGSALALAVYPVDVETPSRRLQRSGIRQRHYTATARENER